MDYGLVGVYSYGVGGLILLECCVGDDYFLMILVYCMNIICDVLILRWKLEKFWFEQVIGSKMVVVKWLYIEVLV